MKTADHKITSVLLAITFILSLLSLSTFANAAGDLEVMVGGKVLQSGNEWFTPLNASNNKVALFSEQREAFSIYNKSKAPITIQSISLVRDKGVVNEEFTLQNTDLIPKPLVFKPTSIAPTKSFDFYIRYYPVQSIHAGATVTITYSKSKKYTFRISGKGRDKAIFHTKTKTAVHKLLGGQQTDEMVTGMVADKQGRLFFSGQAIGIKDRFAYDIFFGCINTDNTLAWAKLWNGPFRDYSRDPGQNDETGGSANAISIDDQGFIYLAGAVSPSKQNNNYAALVIKIDPNTGEPVWEKMWRPDWPGALLAKHSAEAYALDVRSGHVYVTGTTGAAEQNSDALVFLLSLSASDGSIEFQRYVDPTPKSNDRGYAIKADGNGNVYVGGIAAKYGLLVKFKQADTKTPKVAWARTLNIGWGSNVNCLDTDTENNVYLSCDRRGATTYFSVLKMNPDGKLLWGKTYDGGSNKNNNCNMVKVIGDSVYAGGRTGQSWYDAQMGDGILIKLSTTDGSEKWSAFYFNGKGPDEICEHRVKGIAVVGNDICVIGQAYTGTLNGFRYWGYWYDGVNKLSDYKPQDIKDLAMSENAAKDMPKGTAKDASSQRKLEDLKTILPWQDASAKHDGKAPDSDLIFWRMKTVK